MQKHGLKFDAIWPQLQPFDMIAFHGVGFLSEGIRIAQTIMARNNNAGSFTHVGLVIYGNMFPSTHKYFSQSKIYILESVQSGFGTPYNLDGNVFYGVQIRDLHDVVLAYDSVVGTFVSWCPLLDNIRAKISSIDFVDLIDRYNYVPYDGCCNLCGAAFCCFRICRCNDHRMFCSEMVANVYKDLGILPKNVRAEDVVPADYFWSPAGATYDTDRQIPRLFKSPIRFTSF